MDYLRYRVIFDTSATLADGVHQKLLNTVESRKQLGRCIKFSIKFPRVLLNSIVCFLQFSSSYIQIRGIIKVEVFPRLYGNMVLH